MLLCPAELLETSHKPHSFPPRSASPLSEAYLLVSSDHEPLNHHPWLKKITVDHPDPAHGRSVGGQVGVRRCTSLIREPQVLAETDPSPGLSMRAQALWHRDTGRPVPQHYQIQLSVLLQLSVPPQL